MTRTVLARTVTDDEAPVVVVGAHMQSLTLRVEAIPRAGETTLAHDYAEPLDGGKATNQAVAGSRLNAPVRFVSLVGTDDRGRRLLGYLAETGVDTRWVRVEDGATDVGFVMLAPDGIPAITSCQDLSLRIDGEAVAAASGAFAGASVVVCQLEAPIDCATTAFSLARRVGARTILNPAPALPMPPELLALCDVLVPNEHEAAAILGHTAAQPALASLLAARMPWADVIVTAGSAGAYIATADGRRGHVAAPGVKVVDTTGAGDAFVGALAARLRLGDDLMNAAHWAVAAASVSVTRPGTIPAYASIDEVDAAMKTIAGGAEPPAWKG